MLKSLVNKISILLVVLIALSCSNKEYRPLTAIEKKEISGVFSEEFDKQLYQTTMKVFNKELTGVTLIKHTQTSHRVVFMSELGVKYFDIEVPFSADEDPKVHYMMSLLDRKLLVNMLLNDFDLLLRTPSHNSKIHSTGYVYSLLDEKIIYQIESTGINSISKKRCFFKDKLLVDLRRTSKVYPDTIIIDHGNIVSEYISINK